MTKRFYGRGAKARFTLTSVVDEMEEREVAEAIAGSKLTAGVPDAVSLARIAEILKDGAHVRRQVASISRKTSPQVEGSLEQNSKQLIQSPPSWNDKNISELSEQAGQDLNDFLDSLEID